MGRTDYWQSDEAPPTTSLVVTGSAIVTDPSGNVVLHRRVDNGLWALPGGRIELGESVTTGVVREVLEETGLTVEAEYVTGVYSDPTHVMAYTDGEVRQEFSVCVKCRLITGTLRSSSESHEVLWASPQETAQFDMHPRIRARLTDHFNGARGTLNP